MTHDELVRDLVARSRAALKVLEGYSQEQVDALVKAMCLAVRANAEALAKEAVEETRLGRYEDKVIKNAGTPDALWHSLKDKKSVGIIRREPERKLVYVAKPKGVIASVAPTTNPNITALSNSVFAVKGRNTIIVAPHPRAKKTTVHTVDIMSAAIKKLGAPDHVLQAIAEPSVELTQALMRAGDIVVATGGMGMVQAAYSSGKPAMGVGVGNVQSLIDRDADFDAAAADIILGRSFDNGIICAANQSVIMPADRKDRVVEAFRARGAFYSEDPATVDRFRSTYFVDGKPNPKVVGQSALFFAEAAGVEVPENTKVIMLKGRAAGREEPLCGEKALPLLVALTYGTFEEGVEMVKANLLYQGAGHTATIHSRDERHIEYFALALSVSRIIVNQTGIAAAGTNFRIGFNPTTSLGCGSWGNNSISENLTYEHFINISRIGYLLDESQVPDMDRIYD